MKSHIYNVTIKTKLYKKKKIIKIIIFVFCFVCIARLQSINKGL